MEELEIKKLIHEIKAEGYTNICFFLPTYVVGGGAIIAYNIAKALSSYEDLNVYYYDYEGGFVETTFFDNNSNIKFLHYNENEINFPIKEKCIIFTNSTRAILLQKMNSENKLVFWHYETTPIGWNLVFINKEKNKYLSLLKKENALCYHDWSARDSLNRYHNANLSNKDYVQIVIDPKNEDCNGEIINEDEINIAFMSRLVPDKIQALFNLIKNFSKYKTHKKKRLHIIGDGRSMNLVLNYTDKYKDDIEFIFTGTIILKELNKYLISNIDCLFAVGTSVLEGAALKIPSVVLLLEIKPFYDEDAFWLFNSKEYCVGITKDQKEAFNVKYDKISTIIDTVYSSNNKKVYGELCYKYFCKYHCDLESLIKNFLQTCAKSTLTFRKLLKCIKYVPYKFLKIKKYRLGRLTILKKFKHLNRMEIMGIPFSIKDVEPWGFVAVKIVDKHEENNK